MSNENKSTEVAQVSAPKGVTTTEWSSEQIELIKNVVARGATNDELKLFLYTAKRTGLDPLTKQIHFVKRRVWNRNKNAYDDVGTIQTGIDGYRAIAERTKTLAGISDPIYQEELGKSHPLKASVTIYRLVDGQKVTFEASARWNEYAPVNDKGEITSPMWRKMPYLMLGKCAEALALRKAFPNDLSGVYTVEEMAQAEGEVVNTVEVTMLPKEDKPKEVDPTLTLKKKIMDQLKELGHTPSKEDVVSTIEKVSELQATDENLPEISERLAVLISQKNGK